MAICYLSLLWPLLWPLLYYGHYSTMATTMATTLLWPLLAMAQCRLQPLGVAGCNPWVSQAATPRLVVVLTLRAVGAGALLASVQNFQLVHGASGATTEGRDPSIQVRVRG